MIQTTVESVFNATDDTDTESVDLPRAYLRFLLSVTPDLIIWLDSTYGVTDITSEQQAIIESAIQTVTEIVNA